MFKSLHNGTIVYCVGTWFQLLQVKFVVGPKLHKFQDGCARLKPMKSLKVKINDFWGCIVADAEKWIF